MREILINLVMFLKRNNWIQINIDEEGAEKIVDKFIHKEKPILIIERDNMLTYEEVELFLDYLFGYYNYVGNMWIRKTDNKEFDDIYDLIDEWELWVNMGYN